MKSFALISLIAMPLLAFADRFEMYDVIYDGFKDEWTIAIDDNERQERLFYRLGAENIWNNDLYDIIIWNVPDYSKSFYLMLDIQEDPNYYKLKEKYDSADG
jgi:hypothetical protein